jgi:putative ABC transport system permease protein
VTLPIGGDDFGASYVIDGKPAPEPGQEPRAGLQIVSPRYFRTMGMRILRGRDVRPSDTRDAPQVALVNESFARIGWPGEDPIGRRFAIGGAPNRAWLTVIGVVTDIRHFGPAEPPRPEFYRPYYQSSLPFMAMVVRTADDPLALAPSVRAAVLELDPTMPISNVSTMEAHLYRSKAEPRFLSILLGGFALVALTLAAIGIYGMMAFAVTQRTREIGIRVALGARREDILGMVLRSGLWLAAAGAAAGLICAALLTRFLQAQLFETSALEPAPVAAVTLLLLGVAAIAAAVPAWRAARVDVVRALRWD